MGLDWNPLGKPKPGFEDEFASLFQELGESSNWGWFEKIRRRRKGTDREALFRRWTEIQITPHETVGAPQVGSSAEVDAWARESYKKLQSSEPSESEFMEQLQGLYVLALVPPCDGFPYYSNWTLGYVERFSFRAQFLRDCEDIISDETFEKCYVSCLAPGLAALAQQLRACATSYARAKNLEHIEFVADGDFEEKSPERKLHIIYSAARWCEYWSSRGHGLEADW
jgi:hypothetical protein